MYFLVLVDFEMGEMNGDRVIKEIKQIYKRLSRRESRPYMVCVSGCDKDSFQAKTALAAGANLFFTKPLSPNDLLRIFEKAGNRRAKRLVN